MFYGPVNTKVVLSAEATQRIATPSSGPIGSR